MGWQDAPLVGGDQQQGGWQSAPLVNQPTPSSSAPAPASPQGQDIGQLPIWQKPANVGWGEFELAHLKSALPYFGTATKAGDPTAQAAALGSGFTAGATNLIPGAKEAAASLDPEERMALEGVGYAVGPGKVFGALRAGAAGLEGLTGIGARALTSLPAEGAIASGAGTAFQGGSASDIAKAAALGGAAGGVTAAVPGVLSRIPMTRRPTIPDVGLPQSSAGPATGMYAAKTAAYQPLDSIAFDNHSPYLNQAQAIIRASRDPNGLGVDLGIPKDVNDLVAKLQQNPVVSGRNLQEASRDLRNTGDWTGHRFADAIDNVMANAQPIPGTGAVGDAAAAQAAGDLIHGRIQGLERLAADTPSGAPGPTPSAVQKTRQFYDPGSPEYQALTDLQSAMKPSFNWWHLRHAVGPLLGAGVGAVESQIDPEAHRNPWLNAASRAAEGSILFSAMPALARARPGAALNRANYAIATGQMAPPRNPYAQPIGETLRSLLFGQGASGAY